MKKQIMCLMLLINALSTSLMAQTDFSKMPKMTKEWQAIAKLSEAGKTESALKQVESLLATVKKQGNWPQIWSAVAYKVTLLELLRDDYGLDAYRFAVAEAAAAPSGLRSILNVTVADCLSALSQHYAWRNTTDGAPDRPDTWRSGQFQDSIEHLYRAILADKSLLNVSSAGFWNPLNDVQIEASLDNELPTVYDVVLEKIIDYYKNSSENRSFWLNTEGVLANADVFIQKASGSVLAEIWADKRQRLAQNGRVAAAVKVDLARLNYAFEASQLADKHVRYEQALTYLYTAHPGQAVQADIVLAQVIFYRALSPEQALSLGIAPTEVAKKTYEMAKKAVDMYPKSPRVPELKEHLADLLEIILSLQMEAVQLPNQPILARISLKNVEKAYVSIYKAAGEARTEYDSKRLWQWLKRQKPVQTQTLVMPFSRDYNSHSVLFKLDALPSGTYWAVVTTAPSAKDGAGKATDSRFTSFQVSNLAIQTRNDADASARKIIAVDRSTGAPLEGVKAVFRNDKKALKTVVSDKNGLFLPDFDIRDFYTAAFSLGADTLFHTVSGYYYSNVGAPNVAENAIIFTDRQLYRPGQTLYFKLIQYQFLEKNNYKTSPDRDIKVFLNDANGQVVAQQVVKTNAFGSAEGQFTLPTTGLRGRFSVGTVLASTYVSVEEYKRPKFEVTFDVQTETPVLGQVLTVSGRATAFSGAQIDGASGRFTVKRRLRPLFEPYFYGSRRYAALEKEIKTGTFTTDASGRFTIDFPALPDSNQALEANTVYEYLVEAQVTDINGETQMAEQSYKVGKKAVYLSLDMPNIIEKPQPITFNVSVLNAQGTPTQAVVNVVVQRLKQPDRYKNQSVVAEADTCLITPSVFKQLFPNWYLGQALPISQWPVAEQMFGQERTVRAQAGKYIDASNVIVPDGKMAWPAGAYQIILTVKDSLSAETIVHKQVFEVYDAAENYVPNMQMLHVATDKEAYQAGDKAVLSLTTAVEGLWVYIEKEKNDRIIASEWRQISGTQSLEWPITAGDEGDVFVHISYFWQNRGGAFTKTLKVPFKNKNLDIQYGSFRDKIAPGASETLTIKVRGAQKEAVAAELLATLYDASLDALAGAHSFYFWPYQSNNALSHLSLPIPSETEVAYWYRRDGQKPARRLQRLHFTPPALKKEVYAYPVLMAKSARLSEPPPPPSMSVAYDSVMGYDNNMAAMERTAPEKPKAPNPSNPPIIRTNLNELVFFKPQLQTDAQGDITFSFKMNEALTRWRFLALAHTTDLAIGSSTRSLVTQKELMVVPNLPRFFREGDSLWLSAKIVNLSATPLSITPQLTLFDATTGRDLTRLFTQTAAPEVVVAAGVSTTVSWPIQVPTGLTSALMCRIVAESTTFSDGEETILPVLTNRMLVTESLPLRIKAGETRNFEFKSLTQKPTSKTWTPHQVVLELTQNPAWYALQALPYLMEYPFECSEQLFSRFYANSLAAHIMNQQPKIKAVFDTWRQSDTTALMSRLMQNESLKSALLAETPWVLAAQSEAAQRQNMALLFDLAKMADQSERVAQKLAERQLPDGGFPWFNGGEGHWYITQHIVEGLGRLQQLGVFDAQNSPTLWSKILSKAQKFVDKQALDAYESLLKAEKQGKIKLSDNHLSAIWVHYAHTQSLFPTAKNTNTALKKFLLQQMKTYWLSRSVYEQALIALTLLRMGEAPLARDMAASLKERAVKNPDLGYYYKSNRSFYWSEAPIETQAAVIELFDAIGDAPMVAELNAWLIQSKQTQHWGTTKATTAAIFALLKTDAAALDKTQDVKITVANKPIDVAKLSPQAGTGYVKKTYTGTDISPSLGKIKVENPNKGLVLGAMYWQYFEDLDKIKGQYEALPLSVSKQLFVQSVQRGQTSFVPISASTPLSIGDKIRVQLTLTADRAMEFVHLKDMRAAALEPTTTLSGYKFQAGLGYYQSTRDAATDFFFDRIQKGTYVLEYELIVSQKGRFSNGLTTVQCLYAPEFSSHTSGQILKF